MHARCAPLHAPLDLSLSLSSLSLHGTSSLLRLARSLASELLRLCARGASTLSLVHSTLGLALHLLSLARGGAERLVDLALGLLSGV